MLLRKATASLSLLLLASAGIVWGAIRAVSTKWEGVG